MVLNLDVAGLGASILIPDLTGDAETGGWKQEIMGSCDEDNVGLSNLQTTFMRY